MPINVNDPEYINAEREFYESESLEGQLIALKKMISHAPSHKGAENLRQQLTQKRKRLENQIEKKRKKGKSSRVGIKKGEMQAVIVGKTNSGKSSLLKMLTNANPKISSVQFTTRSPIIGIMEYLGTQVQLIEIPPIDGENFEKGIAHTADTILILARSFKEIEEIKNKIPSHNGKEIILLNKTDLLSEEEKRKLSSKMQSKKLDFLLISSLPWQKSSEIENVKKKIFDSFKIIRVFTKQPGKEKEKRPMIMRPGSSVKDAAEKISKDLLEKIAQIKIWGPSSKFGGQVVGLSHKLKDMDVVEFKTR